MLDPEIYREELELGLIPISSQVLDFFHHLDTHPRTILSARFGDGKSYFLQHVNDEPCDEAGVYEFLTIYPVNYQVADNRDIFELVKRDILVQLMMHKMIDAEYEVSDEVALYFWLQNKGLDIAGSLFQYLEDIDAAPAEVKAVLQAFKGLKLFDKLRSKFKEFRRDSTKTRDDLLCEFLDKADEHFIYENDAITRIIRECIQQYKEKNKYKKVALVVEDLDRLDPAHIFRILNVLSAHMDYCNRWGVESDSSLAGNKFGFDNIVLVLDFDNLREIYRHFYGCQDSFEGYINKFCGNGIFRFSLNDIREEFVYNMIDQECHLNISEEIQQSLITPSDFSKKTIRQIKQAVDDAHVELQQPQYGYPGMKSNVMLDSAIFDCMAIMQRLGISKDDIRARFIDAVNRHFEVFLPQIGEHILMMKDKALPYTFYKQSGESLFTAYTISDISAFGTATFEKGEESSGNIGIEEYFITDEYIDFCLKKLW